MTVNFSNYSLAQWFADQEQLRCGYCKNSSGSISYGMMTEQLTVEDYKDLIDRGWRRSGKYCYKPTMNKTCCPQYTIRCNALDFSLNKSHKKIIKKFNKFLNDGIYNKNDSLNQQDETEEIGMTELQGFNKPCSINVSQLIQENNIASETAVQIGASEKEPDKYFPTEDDRMSPAGQSKSDTKDMGNTSEIIKLEKSFKLGSGADPNKPPCKKAKLLRLEKKREKMLQQDKNYEVTNSVSTQKSLTDFLNDISSTSQHKLKLKLIPTSICGSQWETVKDIEYELYKKYQTTIHNDPPGKLSINSFTRFLVSSPLKIELIMMTERHSSFSKSAKLYIKYQKLVHNDECNETDFCDFLVTTPLKPKPFPEGVEGPGYGSFHQQYWIDDKLIAVGVIDILPGAVSSVYFFYDPDYRSLTLGTYGSLRELQLVQDLCSKVPDLQYYYMGFYIHSCPKMRYKGRLKPSFLLCPETYIWQPIEKCLTKLDDNKYSRLTEDPNAPDCNLCSAEDTKRIKVMYNLKLYDVQTFTTLYKVDNDVFQTIASLIGKRAAYKIIFWIS
ncbi:arginyl-tRNA--protein transferase 1 isoform X2 [Sitophilus oryzae]|uniref:Arginyl-tRNA--protein transferase 1 n=1 Tax=Sitophilus oryzae TaxID=7048 RepID=A0A6J2YBK4_SITOR|nr:arginyl-tRNA--protein transferase 1 isoform X2 [Sitophilus oryzae]